MLTEKELEERRFQYQLSKIQTDESNGITIAFALYILGATTIFSTMIQLKPDESTLIWYRNGGELLLFFGVLIYLVSFYLRRKNYEKLEREFLQLASNQEKAES